MAWQLYVMSDLVLSSLDGDVCQSFSPPKPRGVKEGAVTACEEKVGFLLVEFVVWRVDGVKDGDSTLRAFFEL
jgi:hypothetical protein